MKVMGQVEYGLYTAAKTDHCSVASVHGQVDSARLSTAAVGAEPYYLSEALAHRFLMMYETTIQPLFPALDVVVVRGSIDKKFRLNSRGWDVSAIPLRERHQDYPLTTSAFSLDLARDFLVMAFGAQIVGGDGDAECHKDLARAWSEIFRRKTRAILYDVGQDQSDIRVINLWIIFAAYNRSYGNSNGKSSFYDRAQLIVLSFTVYHNALSRRAVSSWLCISSCRDYGSRSNSHLWIIHSAD